MSQLLETIKISNGKAHLLKLHDARIKKSFDLLKWGKPNFKLTDFFKKIDLPPYGIWKCKVIYGKHIRKIKFQRYAIRPIASLKIVKKSSIDYELKWKNRKSLDKLFEKRKGHDDIVIVKNGLVTDSHYCNLLFLRKGKWYTPHKPLLKGVQRAHLLKKNKIIECKIRLEDLKKYEKVKLVNAMIDFKSAVDINIERIYH